LETHVFEDYDEIQQDLRVAWLLHPEISTEVGYGLTGEVFKTDLSRFDRPPVVSKSFDIYKYYREAQCHIEHDIGIYIRLNSFPNDQRTLMPSLVFADVVIFFYSLVISFIEGKVVKFSEMSEREKSACKRALKQLHSFNVLHCDLHYKNFLIKSEDEAVIIDFGFSVISDDKSKHDEESQFLQSKLQGGRFFLK
jgi:serine/threonine protein kinase